MCFSLVLPLLMPHNAAQVYMCYAGWQDYVNRLTDKVATELGVSAEIPVQAQLNKMTLYQTGDQFVAHRNTEKAPGMFATMTIVLPSLHTVGTYTNPTLPLHGDTKYCGKRTCIHTPSTHQLKLQPMCKCCSLARPRT